VLLYSCLGLTALLAFAQPAPAKKLFTSVIDIVNHGTQSAGNNDIRQVDELFRSGTFKEQFPAYFGTEEINGIVNMRGIALEMKYPDRSAVLDIQIPDVDLHFTIDPDEIPGATSCNDLFPPGMAFDVCIAGKRRITELIFKKWLDGDLDLEDNDPSTGPSGATSLAPILEAMVKLSPVEPVAGNPNALDSRMLYGDFRMAMESQFLPRYGEEPLQAKVRTAFDYNYFSAGPHTGNGFDFDVGIEFGTPTPRLSVLLDFPLTVTMDEGSESYMISAALGLVARPTPYWNIIPAFRVGVAGSFEVGALGILYQGSLASTLAFEIYGYDLLIGNMFSAGSSFDGLVISGIEINYNLETLAFTNGFEFGRSLGIEVAKLHPAARLFFTATNFIHSDRRFTPHHYETGVLLTSPVRNSSLDELGLRLGYLGGKGYNSFKLSFSGHW